ncbi:MAG: iron-sulfur cluster assembly scaffold protein [Candidatus Nanoarchaeia archaeon]|nr:iron-sulfur cluster assembly scaffold protein [Candidatus Nanoarchaeia archaeon]
MMDGQDWFYTDVVKEHFIRPRNAVLFDSQIEDMDAVGEVGSPACGDIMKIWIKVKDGKIIKCMWKTFGCASAIASTSMLSEMVIGMTLEDAIKIKAKDILDKLGGLPSKKIHCSVLGDQALKKAIENYLDKHQ